MQLLYEIWQQLNESNVNIDLNKFDKNKVIAKVDVDYIIPGNSDEDNDGEIQFTEQGLVKTFILPDRFMRGAELSKTSQLQLHLQTFICHLQKTIMNAEQNMIESRKNIEASISL